MNSILSVLLLFIFPLLVCFTTEVSSSRDETEESVANLYLDVIEKELIKIDTEYLERQQYQQYNYLLMQLNSSEAVVKQLLPEVEKQINATQWSQLRVRTVWTQVSMAIEALLDTIAAINENMQYFKKNKLEPYKSHYNTTGLEEQLDQIRTTDQYKSFINPMQLSQEMDLLETLIDQALVEPDKFTLIYARINRLLFNVHMFEASIFLPYTIEPQRAWIARQYFPVEWRYQLNYFYFLAQAVEFLLNTTKVGVDTIQTMDDSVEQRSRFNHNQTSLWIPSLPELNDKRVQLQRQTKFVLVS